MRGVAYIEHVGLCDRVLAEDAEDNRRIGLDRHALGLPADSSPLAVAEEMLDKASHGTLIFV